MTFTYNVIEVGKLNRENKEKGIRNFLRIIEHEFTTGAPATRTGCQISRCLEGFAGGCHEPRRF